MQISELSLLLLPFLLIIGFVNRTTIVHIPEEPTLLLLFQLHISWGSHSEIYNK